MNEDYIYTDVVILIHKINQKIIYEGIENINLNNLIKFSNYEYIKYANGIYFFETKHQTNIFLDSIQDIISNHKFYSDYIKDTVNNIIQEFKIKNKYIE